MSPVNKALGWFSKNDIFWSQMDILKDTIKVISFRRIRFNYVVLYPILNPEPLTLLV